MKSLPQPISDAERLVHHYKHVALVKVMRAIIAVAMKQPYVCAGDIPEDVVVKTDRQGCASNGWNALKSLEIIEQLPLHYNNPDAKIFGGRKKNENAKAKGRWVCVYRLASHAAAVVWLSRNGGVPGPVAVPAEKFVAQDLLPEPQKGKL